MVSARATSADSGVSISAFPVRLSRIPLVFTFEQISSSCYTVSYLTASVVKVLLWHPLIIQRGNGTGFWQYDRLLRHESGAGIDYFGNILDNPIDKFHILVLIKFCKCRNTDRDR